MNTPLGLLVLVAAFAAFLATLAGVFWWALRGIDRDPHQRLQRAQGRATSRAARQQARDLDQS